MRFQVLVDVQRRGDWSRSMVGEDENVTLRARQFTKLSDRGVHIDVPVVQYVGIGGVLPIHVFPKVVMN